MWEISWVICTIRVKDVCLQTLVDSRLVIVAVPIGEIGALSDCGRSDGLAPGIEEGLA
jgi:hypothetical protein